MKRLLISIKEFLYKKLEKRAERKFKSIAFAVGTSCVLRPGNLKYKNTPNIICIVEAYRLVDDVPMHVVLSVPKSEYKKQIEISGETTKVLVDLLNPYENIYGLHLVDSNLEQIHLKDSGKRYLTVSLSRIMEKTLVVAVKTPVKLRIPVKSES